MVTETRDTVTQLRMPGMPATQAHANVTCCDVSPGQKVTYLGKVRGGPRFGSSGVVRRTLGRTAVVDIDSVGQWHIPYYYLGVPRAA